MVLSNPLAIVSFILFFIVSVLLFIFIDFNEMEKNENHISQERKDNIDV